MQSIRELYERSRQLSADVVIKSAVMATQENILDLNKLQLHDGLNAKDQIIGEVLGGLFGYKSATYAFEKYSQNPNPGLGNPDLFKTGSFYSGFVIEFAGRRMEIESVDSKNDKLFQNYPSIFGLGPIAQRRYIKQFLQDAVNAKRIEILGL